MHSACIVSENKLFISYKTPPHTPTHPTHLCSISPSLCYGCVILPESEMPGNASTGSHCLELVDHIAWDEIHVVFPQSKVCVANTLTT